MEFNSLADVLIEELGDLYSAEKQLLAAIPKLAAAAHSYELREALESHLEETTHHVERLDQAFAEMGIRFAPTKTCQAMRGLVEEGDAVAEATGDSVAIDAALIGAAQRIEQYEISAYGTARALSSRASPRYDKLASRSNACRRGKSQQDAHQARNRRNVEQRDKPQSCRTGR